MSTSPRFQVDGEWFPLFGVEGESPIEEAQRLAHLREARDREARKFACPDCGELNAMAPPNDRTHPARCPARRHSDFCSGSGGAS